MDPAATTVECELADLLQGKCTSLSVVDVPAKNQDYKPVVRKTVYYVVCAVVVNDAGQILLTQEGFHPCREQWYLPAGRVDPGETLIDAVKREMVEETGLQFEPTTLLALEVSRGDWYRFTFTGRITGGKLLTLADQNEETMQAKWCSIEEIQSGASANKNSNFILRGRDILHLIEIGRTYHDSKITERHLEILPELKAQQSLCLRAVITHNSPTTGDVHVLVSSSAGQLHIPVVQYSPPKTATLDALHILVQQSLGQCQVKYGAPGVLAVEHLGKPMADNDGLCLSMMVTVETKDGLLAPPVHDVYSWQKITSSELKSKLISRLKKHMTLPAFCH